MKLRMKTVMMILLILGPILAQEADDFNIPQPIRSCFDNRHLTVEYKIFPKINPFYLRGNFDGDRKLDYAVYVKQRRTEKEGIIICHGGTSEIAVIGAGTSFPFEGGHMFDDLQDFNVWKVLEPGSIPGLKMHSESIYLGGKEAGGGAIYRKKGKYVWLQLGI
jgi:hypothetical protein